MLKKGSLPATLLVAFVMHIPTPVVAHGGGTDDLGCHNDGQTGEYHCHSGPLDGRTFESEQAARDAFQGRPSSGPASSPDHAYDREQYGDWRDADGDCQDTRTEVLIQEADGPIKWESGRKCEIASGTWEGPFTGETFHDPSELHIDHLVPLKEAHISGAAGWPPAKKRRYATNLEDPRVLIAVEGATNMSKGSDDPAEWLPPDDGYQCRYIKDWVGVKKKWGLAMDSAEKAAIRRALDRCN